MQTTCSSHGACLGGDKVHLRDSSINSCSAPVIEYDKILLHLHWPVLVEVYKTSINHQENEKQMMTHHRQQTG